MHRTALTTAAMTLIALAGCQQSATTQETKAMGEQLARDILIIDTHQDVPYRLNKNKDKNEDISKRTETGHFDYPRAIAGGLDAVFMAVYVPPKREDDGTAKTFADESIDLVEELITRCPDQFTFADSPESILSQFGDGKVSVLLGMENGAPIQGDLANLQHFYDRGIRYITLCHSKCNHICDSSFDEQRIHHGLSPFGIQLVERMNQIGMIIDISHVSDETFYQVIELSSTPVIATHSSCRHFTPGFERNMNDEMIQALAAKGGVIQITFGTIFVNGKANGSYAKFKTDLDAEIESKGLQGKEKDDYISEQWKHADFGNASVTDVADHIDHAVKLVGVDHVGLGSDFDGVDNLPEGLDDVSCYPNLITELLKRNYTEQDIRKICGENLLRVWTDIRSKAN